MGFHKEYGIFIFIFNDESDKSFLSGEKIPLKTWTHVAVTLEGDTCRLYINGEEKAYKSGMFSPQGDILTKNYIGKSNWTDPYPNMKLDEFRIWNKARTSLEIKNNMKKIISGQETGLLAYYRFDQKEGLVLRDYTVNGDNPGLLINGPTWVTSGADIKEATTTAGYIYYDDRNVPMTDPTDIDIEQSAIRRVRYSDEGEITDWALVVDHDFSNAISSGYFENIGNPSYPKGKSWIPAGKRITDFEIDRVINDTFKIDTRYVMDGYRRENIVDNTSTSSSVSGTPDDLNNRYLIPDFTMNREGKITFVWKTQHTVKIDAIPALPDTEKDKLVLAAGDGSLTRTGPGVWWFDKGSKFTSKASSSSCAAVEGYLYNSNAVIEGKTEVLLPGPTAQDGLDQGISLIWKYRTPTYKAEITIGNSLVLADLIDVNDESKKITAAHLNLIDQGREPLKSASSSGDAPETEAMYYWSEDEKKLYPLIGGRTFFLEWYRTSATDCDNKVVTQVTTKWPDQPHYIHIANTPPVPLDPDPNDGIVFNELKYKENDAVVSNGEFSAAEPGKSALLFTVDDEGENALDLNGVDDYVQLPEGVWFKGDFTVETWVYVRKHTSWSQLFNFSNGTASDNVLLTSSKDTDGNLALQIYNNSVGSIVVSDSAIPLNQWSHVAVTLKGKTGRIYINGVEDAVSSDMNIPLSVERTTNYYGHNIQLDFANQACPTDRFSICSTKFGIRINALYPGKTCLSFFV